MNVVEDVGKPGGCAQVIAQVAYSIGTDVNILQRISLDICPLSRDLRLVFKGISMVLAVFLFILRKQRCTILVIFNQNLCFYQIMIFI